MLCILRASFSNGQAYDNPAAADHVRVVTPGYNIEYTSWCIRMSRNVISFDEPTERAKDISKAHGADFTKGNVGHIGHHNQAEALRPGGLLHSKCSGGAALASFCSLHLPCRHISTNHHTSISYKEGRMMRRTSNVEELPTLGGTASYLEDITPASWP